MATDATLWVFEQLGGDKLRIELSKTAAPKGRPQQKAVVADGIELRQNEVYYSGKAPVTRHIFGIKYKPFELEGLWSDAWLGKGNANKLRERMKAFVADKQMCSITWSDVISVTGIIEEFDPSIESFHHIPWTMKIAIDQDYFLTNRPKISQAPSPKGFTNLVLLAIAEGTEGLEDLPLKGSIFDALDSVISAMNEISSGLNQLADQIHDFASAPIELLRRLRMSMHQMRNAILRFGQLYDGLEADLALENMRAEDEQRFWASQSRVSANMALALKAIADADRAAMLAERGRAVSFYVAKNGDTWETISISAYGRADRVADVIAANAVPPGQPPIPGTLYQIAA